MHATLFVAFVTFFYYGYDGIQLTVAMTAAALALRTRRAEAWPPPARGAARSPFDRSRRRGLRAALSLA